MPSASSSPCIGAMVSLAGVALILLGFFLPMFTQSNPQVPGSAHPVYDWQAATVVSGFPVVFVLFGFLAALPVISMLIILATSIAALFHVSLPRFVLLKRGIAGWGLAIQFLFDIIVFQIFGIGYNRIDIALGFVIVLIGFIVMFVGTLLDTQRL